MLTVWRLVSGGPLPRKAGLQWQPGPDPSWMETIFWVSGGGGLDAAFLAAFSQARTSTLPRRSSAPSNSAGQVQLPQFVAQFEGQVQKRLLTERISRPSVGAGGASAGAGPLVKVAYPVML